MRHNHRRSLVTTAVALAVLGSSATAVAANLSAPGSRAAASAAATTARAGFVYTRMAPACAPATPRRAGCDAEQITRVSLRPGQAVPDGVTAHRATPAAVTPHGPNGGFSPADLAEVYHYNRNGGAGQTVAIVDWYNDPRIRADLDAYDTYFHLPIETAKTFRVLNEYGKPSPLPTQSAKDSTSSEIALDVETVRAVCGKCHIILFEARSSQFSDTGTAENSAARLHATEISNSYGGPESPSLKPSVYRRIARYYEHPRIVITASTGDHGWFGWDEANAGQSQNAPQFPADLSSVTAVGGTAFYVDKRHQWAPVVWNSDGPVNEAGFRNGPQGASGGGCSHVYLAATWQRDTTNYSRTGCNGARLQADISALSAYPGFSEYNTDVSSAGSGTPYWFTYGGTSLAAPIIAGMWALAGGSHGVPNPTMTLYAAYHRHPSDVTDVVPVRVSNVPTGSNAYCGGVAPKRCRAESDGHVNTAGVGLIDCNFTARDVIVHNGLQCDAAKGFDGPSGIGTPRGLGIFRPQPLRISLQGARRPRSGSAYRYHVALNDPAPGGRVARAIWLWGDGSRSRGATVHHTYHRARKFTITVAVTDNYGISRTVHAVVHAKPPLRRHRRR